MCEARLRPAAGMPIGPAASSLLYMCSPIYEDRMPNSNGVHGMPYILGFEVLAAVTDMAAGCAFWQLNMPSMALVPVIVRCDMSNDV